MWSGALSPKKRSSALGWRMRGSVFGTSWCGVIVNECSSFLTALTAQAKTDHPTDQGPAKKQIDDLLEKSRGRALSDQEINLALEQAKALG
jgi:hypothetical protein